MIRQVLVSMFILMTFVATATGVAVGRDDADTSGRIQQPTTFQPSYCVFAAIRHIGCGHSK
jgi:hypothetical protein